MGLGSSSIWDANEAFYAETPREMIESGDYVSPSFNYRPRFNKPPLSYWVVAASYHVLGVSEAAERLPIALGGVVMIATAFALGRLAGSSRAGLLAAIALASTPRFLMFSRRIIIDVYVSMFMALALLCFALALARPERRRRYLLLMYVAVGFGVLTKGPVAAVLPGLAVLTCLLLSRTWRLAGRMHLGFGAAIVAAIVAPWYLAVYWTHGWDHIWSFVIDDNLGRYTEPMGGTPRRGLFFYVPVVLGDMFPWSTILPFAAFLGWRGRLTPEATTSGSGSVAGGTRDGRRDVERLLWVWIAVIVGFFSLSQNKQDLYVLPIVPAVAALAAVAVDRSLAQQVWPGLLRWTTILAAALWAAAGLAVVVLFTAVGHIYELAGAGMVGTLAVTGGVAALVLAVRWRAGTALAVVAASLIAANWTIVLVTLPDFERYKPVRPFAALVGDLAPGDALVGYYRFAVPSLAYYMRRPVFEYLGPDQLRAALESGRPVYCLVTERDFTDVRPLLPEPLYVLASRPIFDIKLESVLRRDALPRLLLVSNRPARPPAPL